MNLMSIANRTVVVAVPDTSVQTAAQLMREHHVGALVIMSSDSDDALPIGMLLTGLEPRGRSVRIVLEGDGGGTWVQSLELAAEPTEPELTLVADAIEFCRVSSKRRTAADLTYTAIGDPDLAADVLRAAAVFAA